jgi:hypothetical protein
MKISTSSVASTSSNVGESSGAESPRRTLSITRSKSTTVEDTQRRSLAKTVGVQPRVDPVNYQISVLPHYLGPAPSRGDQRVAHGLSSSSPAASSCLSSASSSSSSSSSSTSSSSSSFETHDTRGSHLLWAGSDYETGDLSSLLRTARATGGLKSVGDTHLPSNVASESDEIALQILQQCKNNTTAASACLVSGSSTGCDEIFLKKNIDADSRSRRGVARRMASREGPTAVSRPVWLQIGRAHV